MKINEERSQGRKSGGEVGQESIEQATILYGHPLAALEFITNDLHRCVLDKWQPIYKREAKDLLHIVELLKHSAKFYTPNPKFKPVNLLVPAARQHWANVSELAAFPHHIADPIPSNAVETAWSDWNNRLIQVKAGRWRNHFRGHRRHVRTGSQLCWIVTLCDYDKDPDLRARYPLAKSDNHPSRQFINDAEQWRGDYRQPQIELQKKIEAEWFAETDKQVEEFRSYCQKAGIKVY